MAQSPKLASGSKASPGVGIGAGNVHVNPKDAMIGNFGADVLVLLNDCVGPFALVTCGVISAPPYP